MGEGRPDGVDGALHVDVDHLLELVVGEVQDRSIRADPGIDDEDVELAEPLCGLARDGDQGRRVPDVRRSGDGSGDAQIVPAARCQPEPHAGGIEGSGDRRPDASTRAGDQRDATVQGLHGPSSAPRIGARAQPTLDMADRL